MHFEVHAIVDKPMFTLDIQIFELDIVALIDVKFRNLFSIFLLRNYLYT
jgi:hypothetical protein